MKKKILVVLAGVVAVLALSGFGPGGGCGRSADPQERFARVQEMVNKRVNDVLDELKATPDQRAQILAIKDRAIREAQAQLEQDLGQRQADKQWAIQQLTSDAPDKAALYAKLDAKADQLKTNGRKVIDVLVEVNAVLTPAQRAQLRAKIEELAQRHGGGFGGPMGY